MSFTSFYGCAEKLLVGKHLVCNGVRRAWLDAPSNVHAQHVTSTLSMKTVSCTAHDARAAIQQLVPAVVVAGKLEGAHAGAGSALSADHVAAGDAERRVSIAICAERDGHVEILRTTNKPQVGGTH